MLLLVTLALVVASAVLLVLGFVQDALGFIYLSMLCAGVAALALFVFARLAKRRGATLAGAGVAGGMPSPYAHGGVGEERPEAGEARPRRSRSRATAGREDPVVEDPAFQDPALEDPDGVDEWAPRTARARGRAPLGAVEDWIPESDPDKPRAGPEIFAPAGRGVPRAPALRRDEAEDESDDWGDEVVFPIADYDDLRAAEVLPLLSQLDADELQEVRDRELAGKARATILDRIDDRLGRRRTTSAPAAVTTAALPVLPADGGEAGRGPAADVPGPQAGPQKAPAKKAPARKAAAKKAAAKKAGAKGTSAQKAAPQKATAKRAPGQSPPAQSPPLQDTPAQETAGTLPPPAPAPMAAPEPITAAEAPPPAEGPTPAEAPTPAEREAMEVAPGVDVVGEASPVLPAAAPRRPAKKAGPATGSGAAAKKAAGTRKAAAKKAPPARQAPESLPPPEPTPEG